MDEEKFIVDCSNYINCAQEKNVVIDMSSQDILNMIAVGCWGVYCDGGEYIIAKYKENKLKQDTVIRGQLQVANALVNYKKLIIYQTCT